MTRTSRHSIIFVKWKNEWTNEAFTLLGDPLRAGAALAHHSWLGSFTLLWILPGSELNSVLSPQFVPLWEVTSNQNTWPIQRRKFLVSSLWVSKARISDLRENPQILGFMDIFRYLNIGNEFHLFQHHIGRIGRVWGWLWPTGSRFATSVRAGHRWPAFMGPWRSWPLALRSRPSHRVLGLPFPLELPQATDSRKGKKGNIRRCNLQHTHDFLQFLQQGLVLSSSPFW